VLWQVPKNRLHQGEIRVAELIIRREGAVGTILVSNPEKFNAMSYDMWCALPRALAELDADPAVRAIVLTGQGERAFISGADISQFEALRGTEQAQAEYGAAVEAAYQAPAACTKPVIAGIRGICIGGGLGLALACDVRLCADDAVFRMPAARLGLGYSPAGVRRFVQMLGPSASADLFFSARVIRAEEALWMGLVSQMHPSDSFAQALAEYGATVAANAPLTLAAAKFAIGEALRDPDAREPVRAAALASACGSSDDYKEGRRAFMEKRAPRFQGR
jgi:enoyl-CoA hydratase